MAVGLIGTPATVTRVSSSTTKVTSTTPSFPVSPSYLTATVMVVAGGGGAGTNHAGGAGGGGARLIQNFDVTPFHGTTPITIGGGGDGAPTPGGPPNGITFTGEKGSNSSAFGYSATGGGKGQYSDDGGPGGAGGGGNPGGGGGGAAGPLVPVPTYTRFGGDGVVVTREADCVYVSSGVWTMADVLEYRKANTWAD